jgi:hypothetical protein
MRRLTTHLDVVDETYAQHFRHATSFALEMFAAGLACLVHAVLPFLFERTGSDCIRRLHERMVVNRHRLTARREGQAGALPGT